MLYYNQSTILLWSFQTMYDNSFCTFLGFLTLLFVGLKLCNVITWSWLWVLSPLLIPMAFGLLVSMVFFGLLIMAFVFEKTNKTDK